jgi:transposase
MMDSRFRRGVLISLRALLIREVAMARAVPLNEDMSAAELRCAAAAAKDANQARRLLALAAVRDGMSRTEAARIGGMDRQTLRDWVHAYNEHGVNGLINKPLPGRPPKLSAEQKAEIGKLVEAGPDIEKDGLVRWRLRDLACIAEQRFGVKVDEDTIGRVLREQGFSHISARPRHPAQDVDAIEDFKKTSQKLWQRP